MVAANKNNQSERIVVDAAIQLFSTKGYHGTSIRDIAQKSSLNVSVISYYFSSKEKLYLNILKRIYCLLEEKINTINSLDLKKQQLLSFIDVTSEFALSYSCLMKIFLQEIVFNISMESRDIVLKILHLHKSTFVKIFNEDRLDLEFHFSQKANYYYNFITGTISNTWMLEQVDDKHDENISEKINAVKYQIITLLNLK